jgi:FKBP-type peptidyl-prolyl cis-trans isomerase 2
MVEVTNEFGEVISYRELGHGGKVVATYDKDRNLTATYNYNKYGKAIVSIVNEMTKGMTVFDEKTGLAMYDLDYEGYRIGKYIYDDKNRLAEKIDGYGNVTYFDGKGNVTHAIDKNGTVLSRYNYKYDDDGNYILESVINPRTNDITYFDEQGRQTATKNYAGAVTTDYFWMGSKLVAMFDRESQRTTWFAVDGKTLYTTFNDQLVSKHLYYEGQLVGIWDARTNQVTVLHNERMELIIQLGSGPNYPTEAKTLVRCFGENGGEIVLSLEDFRRQSGLGKKKKKIEEFTGYVLRSDENGNIVEYDPVREPTAEMIRRGLDDGLIDKKYLVISL